MAASPRSGHSQHFKRTAAAFVSYTRVQSKDSTGRTGDTNGAVQFASLCKRAFPWLNSTIGQSSN